MSHSVNSPLSNLNINNSQFVLNGAQSVSFKTQFVSLPGIYFPPASLETPSQEYFIPGMKFRPDPLIIRFVVDEYLENYFEMLKWIVKTREYEEDDPINEVLKDCTVNILDNHDKENAAFRYTSCFIQGLDSVEGETTVGETRHVVATATIRFQNVVVDIANGKNAGEALEIRI